MPVVLTPRAQIDDAFMELARDVYRMYLNREKADAEMFPGGYDRYMRNHAPAHAKALSVLRIDRSDGRTGAEYEMTRLRALPYTRFTAVTHGEERYLCGMTKPIVIEDGGVKYYLGSYAVYVPFSALVNRQTSGFHFLPTKFPQSCLRTPHHKTNESDVHPLERNAYTCWGTFGPTISALVHTIDIPELFRYLQIYLSRYDPHSPLVHGGIRNLDFDMSEAS